MKKGPKQQQQQDKHLGKNVLGISPKKYLKLPGIIQSTFRRAVYFQDVNHRSTNPEESKKTPLVMSDNHGIYLGKTIGVRKNARRKILETLMLDDEIPYFYGNLYNPDFLEGVVETMKSHLQHGQTLHIVLAHFWSKVFNGPEKWKDIMSVEDQKEILMSAAKKAGMEKRIKIVDLEHHPDHQDLIIAIKESLDPETGTVDPDKAFGDEFQTDPAKVTSLDVAKIIFQAMQANPEIKEIFESPMPESKNVWFEGEEDERITKSKKCYAMAEIAFRLMEILHGRSYQGGATRQSMYDNIIIDILKGRTGQGRNKKGKLRDYKELESLFDLFEGQQLDTLYFVENPAFHAIRARTRIRINALVTAAALGFSTCTLTYQCDKDRRDRIEEAMETRINKGLSEALIKNDQGKSMNETEKIEYFQKLTQDMTDDVNCRILLDFELREKLQPLLIAFLLKHKDKMGMAFNNVAGRHYLVDLFIYENNIVLASIGLNFDHPYPKLKEYEELIVKTAHQPDPNVRDRMDSYYATHMKGVGSFKPSTKEPQEPYQFYQYPQSFRNDVKLVSIIEVEYVYNREMTERRAYTSSTKAKEGAVQYMIEVQRYDLVGLDAWQEHFLHFCHSDNHSQHPEKSLDPREVKTSKTYKDYWGTFEYQITVTNERHPILFARKPGEAYYTTVRAAEAADHYCKTFYSYE